MGPPRDDRSRRILFAQGIAALACFLVVHGAHAAPPPVCRIASTPGPDHLLATGGNDAICGLGGQDTILGRGGSSGRRPAWPASR